MVSSIFHIVVVLTLLSDVRASSSASSASDAAGEVSIVNTSNVTDICSQDEYSNDCWYPVTCKTCLARAGCAVEVSTGRCISNSSSAVVVSESTTGSSAQFFLSGDVKYCSAIDPACFTCRRGNAPAVCLGSSNCVCVSQCELISSRPTKCNPSRGMSSGSLLAAAAVILPLVTYLIFKGSPCGAGCSVRRLLQHRRRERQRRDLPGALKLDAWRTHLSERAEPVNDQFADLELRSCFVPMQSRRQPRAGEGAETGGAVHVEDGARDVSRAVAATDLPLSPSAERRAADGATTREAAAAATAASAAELV